MFSTKTLLFTIAITVAPRLALAAQDIQVGVGAMFCGNYLNLREKASVLAVASWAQGFIVGVDLVTRETNEVKLPDEPSIKLYLDKHCRQHPLDDIMQASIALSTELDSKRKSP
jgi:hypothetical protein